MNHIMLNNLDLRLQTETRQGRRYTLFRGFKWTL